MNLLNFLLHLGHVIGLLKGSDPTVTTLSTVDDLHSTKLTTPIILDTSTLETIYDSSRTVSPKLLSTITSNHQYASGSSVTGIKPETESVSSSTGSDTPSSTGSTGSASTSTGTTISSSASTGSSEKSSASTGGSASTGSSASSTGSTGKVTTVSASTASTAPTSTEAAPTEKPGLSRGAVAGIVIGCLLLIAVIAAAIVFFLKNRNNPAEAQRLRV